jgi:hypothetical protein
VNGVVSFRPSRKHRYRSPRWRFERLGRQFSGGCSGWLHASRNNSGIDSAILLPDSLG